MTTERDPDRTPYDDLPEIAASYRRGRIGYEQIYGTIRTDEDEADFAHRFRAIHAGRIARARRAKRARQG